MSTPGKICRSRWRHGTARMSQFQPMLAISRSARIEMICRRAHNDRGSGALRSPLLAENALPCPTVRLP
jgi:hypothetical protein